MTTIHAIRSKRVVTPNGIRAATVHIRDGTIEAVTRYNDLPADENIYDAGESVVMPGLVDTHVHINEPGRTYWEGFETATRAAAAGGVTTLIDMPLNSIPATTTVAALETKRAAAHEKCWVNVGFWGASCRAIRENCKRCTTRERSASSVF
jgi:allantoinase